MKWTHLQKDRNYWEKLETENLKDLYDIKRLNQ